MFKDRDRLVRSSVEHVKSIYNIANFDGLKQAVSDHGILLIESPKVIVPCTIYKPELDRVVIFTRKPRFKNLRYWFLGHEFGHARLGHLDLNGESAYFPTEEKEEEAQLFASLLRGQSEPCFQLYCDALELMLRRRKEVERYTASSEQIATHVERILRTHITMSAAGNDRY